MVFYAVASLAQGYAARRASGPAVLRHPAYLAGLCCDVLAWLASLVAFEHLPLFVVQALLAGSLALTVLGAIPLLHIRPSRRDLAAVGMTTLGLIIVSASAGGEASVRAPGWFQAALWVLAGATAIAGALLYRRGGAIALGTVAGLGYSVTALAARAGQVGEHGWLETVRSPYSWALVIGGALGVVLYARALERAVGAATAGLWVVEVLVPGALGVAVLGDPIRAGWWLPAIVGIALAVAGCVVLAQSDAQG